jgi:hypothetical protein
MNSIFKWNEGKAKIRIGGEKCLNNKIVPA